MNTTLTRTPSLDTVARINNECDRPIIINHQTTPSELDRPFVIYDDSDKVVLAIDSGNPSDSGYASPPVAFLVQPGGAEGVIGTANRITYVDANGVFGGFGTNVQSGRVRGFDSLMLFKGDLQKTGYGGEESRSANFSFLWGSSDTCDEGTGVVNNMFSNASGLATGTVDRLACNKGKIGFNNTNGSAIINTGRGFWFESPKNVVNSNYIGTLVGCDIEDLTGTNITEAIAYRSWGETPTRLGVGTLSDGYETYPGVEYQSANVTPVSIQTFTLEEDHSYYMKSIVVARDTANTHTAMFEIVSGAHRNTAGAAVLDATTTTIIYDSSAAMNAVHVANGNDIEVQITGLAGNVEWSCTTKAQNMAGG